MRCAIYARYSSDLQRESSIDDQIRKCREYAGLKGWLVLDGYIRSDNAVSGAALATRDALNSLIADAMGRPRPFDRILVDDTSRLARHLADSLTIVERLQFRGVGVVFVSQGIDFPRKDRSPAPRSEWHDGRTSAGGDRGQGTPRAGRPSPQGIEPRREMLRLYQRTD